MSPEFEFLNKRIDRIAGVTSAAFRMDAILLGFIIDMGLLSPEETASRLQSHFDNFKEDIRDGPKGLFVKMMLSLALKEIEEPSPPDDEGGRPSWFRGVIEGGVE